MRFHENYSSKSVVLIGTYSKIVGWFYSVLSDSMRFF